MSEDTCTEPAGAPQSIEYANHSKRVLEFDRLLAAANGHPKWHSHGPPLDVLIATILSQHTSDSNTARSFAGLCARFPTWDDVVMAPVGEIADAIRTGGLADIKAPRIQHILRIIQAKTGHCSLDWLNALPLADAREWLVALPGVGPKTAACVLLFSLGLPAMPVDTHVLRVSKRLGLIGRKVNAEAAHEVLEQLIGSNRDLSYSLHLNLIQHGRQTCKARKPACTRCPLVELCPSAFQASLDSAVA